MKNTTKIKVHKKYQDRIEEVFNDSDGYWCYLRGWCWDDPGLHVIHEDTQKEVLECIRQTKPCTCNYCRGIED